MGGAGSGSGSGSGSGQTTGKTLMNTPAANGAKPYAEPGAGDMT